MRTIDCGISGAASEPASISWGEIRVGKPWDEVIRVLNPGPTPRPAQVEALAKLRILEARRNLIVSAPTNGGKSLIGLLVLLEAIRRRRRAVLLEPLRALAREKADELEALAPVLAEALGVPFRVRITTGDYRLDDEAFDDRPPEVGEVIVATPERIEAVMRNPNHDGWVSQVGAVCVDEAHLISSPRRGPTLEYLITSLLCLPAPPRLALLTATLGNAERAQYWLSPCDLVRIEQRHPPLLKEVVELGADEDANQAVIDLADAALGDPSANVLVFVYQTRATERLAAVLNERLLDRAGIDGALAYHAQMSFGQREAARKAFLTGRTRCVVSTTALGLGVNLPATHVVVRDPTFPGIGRVAISDLLQMMGRAGRGERAGKASVIVRATDGWDERDLVGALRAEALPGLVSHFELGGDAKGTRGLEDVLAANAATHVAAQLARRPEDGLSLDELNRFFARSLGGKAFAERVRGALIWLSDPSRALSFRDGMDRYRLTVLGLSATRSVLPLSMAAGIGQLLRDLLSVDSSDGLLAQWQPLDHLIVLELLRERPPKLRPFSQDLAAQVDMWMEAVPGRDSMLFRNWLGGDSGSRAGEVLGSLGLGPTGVGAKSDASARKTAYAALFHAIVIHDRGLGTPADELERRWRMTGLDGIEERWRDELLWLLSGVASIVDIRYFFFHLREGCDADRERIRRVKRLLSRMRAQTFELREQLKYCSPLGPLLRSIQRTEIAGDRPRVGIQTIRRLEGAGVASIAELAEMDLADLVRLGVRRDYAKQIRMYLRRRLR